MERDTADHEFRRDNTSGVAGLAINIARLVQHDETVAAAQVMIEIDIAVEYVRERERDRVGQPGIVGGREQRRFDFTGTKRETHVLDGLFALRDKTGRRATDRQHIAVAREEAQARQATVVVGRNLECAARAQLVERTRGRIGTQELHRFGIVDRCTREQAADRVAPLDALFAPIAVIDVTDLDERRHGQRSRNALHGDRVERRVGRDAERGDASKAQHGDRQSLAWRQRMCDGSQCRAKRLR